jgi:2-polyprenyl-6-methoxyphenol hydroxylase-like FAD-dependent oxidoreductase
LIGADGAQSRVRQIVAREMIGREAVYDSVNNPGVSVLGAVLDVSCRVALASTVDRGWHRTAAMGVFAPPGFSGAP